MQSPQQSSTGTFLAASSAFFSEHSTLFVWQLNVPLVENGRYFL
jgi:hypothetical protein